MRDIVEMRSSGFHMRVINTIHIGKDELTNAAMPLVTDCSARTKNKFPPTKMNSPVTIMRFSSLSVGHTTSFLK